jgi:phenylacetate-coenzyme A ligase PaaK-like adenylate-forming protein
MLIAPEMFTTFVKKKTWFAGHKITTFSFRVNSGNKMDFKKRIFNIVDDRTFNQTALEIFRFQYEQCEMYHQYVDKLGMNPSGITHFRQIPFLPIIFFKTHPVKCGNIIPEKTFLSSGTTGMEKSSHPIIDLKVYKESLLRGFETFYGSPDDYDIFALMPSPEENPDSSLIFMVAEWIRCTRSEISGFYLDKFKELAELLTRNNLSSRKPLIIGLTYALLDFAEMFQSSSPELIIMETGGMKGKRKEMIREELHAFLKEKTGISPIHSEYGMTELLSQAYSKGNGRFHSPGWMKVLIRDPNDPFQLLPFEKPGCINIIDLANFNSCSFIATGDLGKTYEDGSFEVLGRFDPSNVRGCNLMVV